MGSILSIDYGLKRIGLAVSDSSRSFAFPYGVIENKNFNFVLSSIKNIVDEKEIDLIIVGRPYHKKLENQKSMEELVCEFITKLKASINVSIETVDERFSSFLAEENLKESGLSLKKSKRFVDTEAARLLLEEFLQKSKS